MPGNVRLSLLVGAGLLLALSCPAIGDEPEPKVDPAEKYRELVRQLASPNKEAIKTKGSPRSVTFPEGYDKAAQIKVKTACQELYEHFEQALPYLVDALDDKRYCMTINWAEGDGYYNESVGSICKDVITSQLEVYRRSMRFGGPREWHRYDYSPISKEWWQERKGRSLAELQTEAINWAIERRKSEAGADEKEIAKMEQLREEIAKSGKPAEPRRMFPMVTSDK